MTIFISAPPEAVELEIGNSADTNSIAGNTEDIARESGLVLFGEHTGESSYYSGTAGSETNKLCNADDSGRSIRDTAGGVV